ncbi:hypothetical protein [Rhodococcus sp. A5(2022)]|uniref:hypothetical protein n=1 Tax=Rhodococcus sp. A5(2022) TaxID=3003588 RepID=UPI0022A85A3A|nr:hypothetical protein [Rhodococcus sp. A5(2022)]MCZ1075077.1 hypothetical protein [Rhodococcus sp. A5(2022)]
MDVLDALAAYDRSHAEPAEPEREPEISQADAQSPAGAEFGPGGTELYRALFDPLDPYDLTAMVIEASRIKDQLDQYHRMLTGNSEVWFRVVPARGDSQVLEVKATGVAQEARQLTNVWRQLLAEIRRRKGATSGSGSDDDLDDL